MSSITTSTTLTHGLLHSTILQYIIDHGYAPETADLVETLQLVVPGVTEQDIINALHALQDYHGVVLHPNSNNSSTRIWAVHPFSAAPTNFIVRTHNTDQQAPREYWASCAWCALGAAALLERDVTITTTLGADRRQVDIAIQNGKLVTPNDNESQYVVHFAIPMTRAWDNVTYTCSTMLLFDNETDVTRWCTQHRMVQGDVQPLDKIWEFAKVWYGNHLNPAWEKWTNQQASDIFQRFDLTHPVWHIPLSKERF